MPIARTNRAPRTLEFALFLVGLVWMLAAQSAARSAALGIATTANLPAFEPVLQQAFFVVLLMLGFTALGWTALRRGGIRATNALPTRATAAKEWGSGIAVGWGMLLVAVLPMMIAGVLRPQFLWAPRYWGLTLLALAAVALGTLAVEVAFRGFLYRRLMEAFGEVGGTIFAAAFYALLACFSLQATLLSWIVMFALGLIYSLCYLRTRALWLGWGLHFGWAASMGVLFGLPVMGSGAYSAIVVTDVSGPGWLSGYTFGPEASVVTLLVCLAVVPLVYKLSRDWAWEYTAAPVVPGGYPMEAQPPAAHVAMQNSVAPPPPPPLVQILGTTSTNPSTMPVIDEHLRGNVADREMDS